MYKKKLQHLVHVAKDVYLYRLYYLYSMNRHSTRGCKQRKAYYFNRFSAQRERLHFIVFFQWQNFLFLHFFHLLGKLRMID